MKKLILSLLFFAATLTAANAATPWHHGRLMVSADSTYLQHADGTPFFWLGDTGWLLPQRLTHGEADHYLSSLAGAGFNVVQVQVMNGVPSENVYGSSSMPHGYDFDAIGKGKDGTAYWDNMDRIVATAAAKGIYVGMVCVWGGQVKAGRLSVSQARRYGRFLARRYKDCPNIVWIIGGDIRGDIKPEVWNALAEAIKAEDKNHLMTFHPFGRTMSATWFNNAKWLDFNMSQSGHRRYGQRRGDGDYTIEPGTEEDNWRYVEKSLAFRPLKPVLDAEPIYENIPQGLHDTTQPRWTAKDVRRYAYWSVFAGSCGHTYGHNSIMQFYKPGISSGYGNDMPWYDALKSPGFNQMKHLKRLMLAFPPQGRVADNAALVGGEGYRYDYIAVTRGKGYMLAYDYSARPMTLDLGRMGAGRKKAWWYGPADGSLQYIGEFDAKPATFSYDAPYMDGHDRVLIVTDGDTRYVEDNLNGKPQDK